MKSADVILTTSRFVNTYPSVLPRFPALSPFLTPHSSSSPTLRPKIRSTADHTTASSWALIETGEKRRCTLSSWRLDVLVIVDKRSGSHCCLAWSHTATGGSVRCVRKLSDERVIYDGSR